MHKKQVRSLGQEDSLEKGMATDSSILTWRISQTEKHKSATVHRITESDTTERLTLSLHFFFFSPKGENIPCVGAN